MRGAEAVLEKGKMLGRSMLVKKRIPKTYRISELDQKLRRERTRQEARLLHRAKLAGVGCPIVLFVDEFSIGMTRINGKRPEMDEQDSETAGEIMARLHNAGIIHGDFTPANLLRNKEGIFVIDFGLGFLSADIEDKAIDVLTMLKSLGKEKQAAFLRGYVKVSPEYGKIAARLEEIRKRARYA
ncbi:putative bifunctional tRNA threonylcarbamoyladenosine biosynthesis protein [uncultured archaeon]|nr:putative bifunctional tRNA threonylcarbamoyladenosine biosynthesis protein [uncultured archaeon]